MRLVAALSGGVDSSVMAGLLKEAGHEVIGITLKLAPDAPGETAATRRCCSVDDALDARTVSALLDIPFYVLDAQERFRRRVMDPFAAAYRAGLTPIPCVTCNSELKFGHLLERALALGGRLATGHYARKVEGPLGPELHRPADADRDQTYFLHAIGRDALAQTEFPLGDLLKADVRKHAERMGLPVSGKPDSQEICFVPNDGHAAFVERWDGQGARPGRFVDAASGESLGQHRGVHAVTVGQRKGLGITSPKRLYVLQVDAGSGDVLLGNAEDLTVQGLVARDASWLVNPAEQEDLWRQPVQVQIRARHKPAMARLEPGPQAGTFLVFFEEPQNAVAPGQSAVVYQGSRCLGGGVIQGPASPVRTTLHTGPGASVSLDG